MDDNRGRIRIDWLGFITAAATAVWMFASVSTQVQQNKADIAAVRADLRATTDVNNRIDARLARIEATLEIITGGARLPREGRSDVGAPQ